MTDGLKIGIASQTPLVRMKRSLEELESEHGPLPDPIPLSRLTRGPDFSITPGGVARMIHSAIETVWARNGITGQWATLDGGFPRDLSLDGFRLTSVPLDAPAKAAYGEFKEVMWEAINGLPPKVDEPLNEGGRFRERYEGYLEWNCRSAEALLAADATEDFDLYYLNDWQELAAGAHLSGKPRIMHFHAPFAEWTPPGWKRFLLQHLRGFDGVIVSTHAFADALRTAGYEKPVHQVYPWLDPGDYRAPPASALREFSEKFGLRDDDDVVLHVGRMDPVKGQDRLLRAMPELLRRNPRAKLVLVGNGSFSSSKSGGMGLSKGKLWRAQLEALAADLGIEERVVFTGHLPQGEVVAALHRCDTFAFPSVGEGFGLAVAEAWLARKPAVVSPGAGISEIITHRENSLVVDATDPHALAGALAEVLALPDKGRAMGEAARATAMRACDVWTAAWQTLDILESHVEGRAPKATRAPAPRVR